MSERALQTRDAHWWVWMLIVVGAFVAIAGLVAAAVMVWLSPGQIHGYAIADAGCQSDGDHVFVAVRLDAGPEYSGTFSYPRFTLEPGDLRPDGVKLLSAQNGAGDLSHIDLATLYESGIDADDSHPDPVGSVAVLWIPTDHLDEVEHIRLDWDAGEPARREEIPFTISTGPACVVVVS